MAIAEPARVYNVSGGGRGNGESSSSLSTSLPDLLRRHGRSNKRKSRNAQKVDEQLDRIELLQDFEFPEASNVIKSTRDGQHIVATGTYKPQMRVWECEQLSLKFERHSDAETTDFVLLSDDWTKSLHLQNDRTLELHGQGGHHARLRIPKFGRALGYHFGTANALVGAAGNEVFRLNLDQGRFMAPLELGTDVRGVNAVDVNPAHGLLSFGAEGSGENGVEIWDLRSRTRAGTLNVATRDVIDAAIMSSRRKLPGVYRDGEDDEAALADAVSSLSVTALSTSSDGLNLAAGTSTGHVLLYDLRMTKPYATKDQGFGLPIKSLSWPSDHHSGRQSRPATEKRVLSADEKVIKVWSSQEPSENIVTITPSAATGNLNSVHQLPGTGLVLAANEATRCAAWYVPELGVAPKWCSFLDILTDEADGEVTSTSKKGTYEDFKFVDQAELDRLGLTHLIGSPVLRPYMHGFFMSLKLYDKARLVSNPTAFADARERAIKAKMEQLAESRIRESPKELARRRRNEKELETIQVNRDLAAKLRKEADREERAAEKKAARAAAAAKEKRAEEQEEEEEEGEEGSGEEEEEGEEEGDAAMEPKVGGKSNLLQDSRFAQLFTNPDFEVDETSREFAMLNPRAAAAQKKKRERDVESNTAVPRKLTAVEAEEAESDRESLDPDQEDEGDSDGSDDSGRDDDAIYQRNRANVRDQRLNFNRSNTGAARGVRPVDEDDIDDEVDDDEEHRVKYKRSGSLKGRKTFGQRMHDGSSAGQTSEGTESAFEPSSRSYTFTPGTASSGSGKGEKAGRGKKKGEETFGAGLSKGAGSEEGVGVDGLEHNQRFGRDKRRKVGRSASKNVMRERQ